jgi:hypothetical protein
MKKICILLFCLSVSILNAQNYQNICSPGITFFKNSTGNIKAFSQDSVYLPGFNDSIFISYRTIRPFQINNCYDTTNGSILGRKVYKKHDGTFYFFNWNHDTLTIKAQAALNDTWKFCNLPGGSKIDATVINISPDTVLGLADEVKVLSLQAKDINGNNISHFLNQKTINLSQHFGISKTFDLYFMPDIEANDTSSYILNGKTALQLGIQNLTWQDIYNFDVGDEFHWSGYYWYSGPSWQIIKRILGKEVFGNVDSVKYTIEYCKIMWLPQPPPNVQRTHDTILEFYDFVHVFTDSSIGRLPDAFSHYYGYNWLSSKFARKISFPNKQTQDQIYDYYQLYSDSIPCWNYAFEGGGYEESYTEGLGLTYKYYGDGGLPPVVWTENMVYYKKGSETWGTPLAPNCSALLPVETLANAVVPFFNINPNPVETQAEISLEGFKQSGLRYSLYNSLGQQVCIREVHSNPFIFNRSGLPGGLYIIYVIDDSNSILAIKKIMLK